MKQRKNIGMRDGVCTFHSKGSESSWERVWDGDPTGDPSPQRTQLGFTLPVVQTVSPLDGEENQSESLSLTKMELHLTRERFPVSRRSYRPHYYCNVMCECVCVYVCIIYIHIYIYISSHVHTIFHLAFLYYLFWIFGFTVFYASTSISVPYNVISFSEGSIVFHCMQVH